MGCSSAPDAALSCDAEHECRDLPAECDGERSCDCITGVMCPRGISGMCEGDGYGNAMWRCIVF